MSESEPSDYEEADDVTSARPTPDDIGRIRLQLSEKCSIVNAYLLSSREPVEKKRLIENTLLDLLNAYNQIAATYLRVSASIQTTSTIKNAIMKSMKQDVTAAVQNALPSLRSPVVGGSSSYADIVSKSSTRPDSLKVRVTNGPTVVIPNTVSVVIGPKTACSPKFETADETRKAIMKAVKLAEVDIRVNKVVNMRNKAVRIIADSLDVAKLKNSQALDDAGVEVKEREKLNPRLVIRDVPTDLTSTELIADISAFNLDGQSKGDIKIVYRYPSRLKNGLASVVIETNADIRLKLLRKGRICLSWQSC